MKKVFLFILIALSIKDTLAQTVTDIDGNVYNTLTIGTQVWMKENLKTSHYRNGDAIPTGLGDTAWWETTSGAYSIYANDAANNATYGKAYNWYAAVNDPRGLAPAGWHVPSDAEWTTLIDYLTNNGYGYQGSGNDIGKSMAATSNLILSIFHPTLYWVGGVLLSSFKNLKIFNKRA